MTGVVHLVSKMRVWTRVLLLVGSKGSLTGAR